jgi:type I restriction enzyme S subunit
MKLLTPRTKATRLDDLGFVSRGRSRHRPRNDASLYGGKYPFFQTGDIKAANLYLTEFSQTYNEAGLAQSKMWDKGTLCITIAANIAETAILGIPGCFPDSVVGFVPDPEKADVRFIKYYIDILKLGMQSVSRGTTQDNMSVEKLMSFDFDVPDLPTQRKIAGILSAYDDLIENNLRRIKILEEMAQSLYREWFVHFRFPGHESATFTDSSLGRIPNGWEVRKILDFANVIYGFSFKANRFNTAGEGLPVVRIRNIQDGKSETYTEEEGDPKHRIRNGDILVGMDGDFHMTIWSGGDAWQNQRVAKFRPKGPMGNYFLFLAIEKPIHFFNSTITGTTVAHLGDSHIKTIEFASPPESLMRKASDLLEPLAQEQLNLRRRNQTLRRTRDLLLPKLLSPS